MKYLLPFLIAAVTGGFIAWNATVQTQDAVVGANPRTFQAEQLNATYSNGQYLRTDGSGNLSWAAVAGGSGGGVGWATSTDNNLLYSTVGQQILLSAGGAFSATTTDSLLEVRGSVSANNFTATATNATSTFPLASITTGLSLFGTFGDALSDFCVAITGGSGLCDGTDNTGSGGGLATSTAIADTLVIYGTSAADVGAEAAFTYDDATDKLTVVNASTTNLSATSLWGTLTGNVTGNVTGNADTATALAANGANCSAGNAPLGVDASGAVESCFDVWTEAENTSAAYIALTNLSATSPIQYNSGTGAFTFVGVATSTALADTQIVYGTAAGTIGSESAFVYDDATDKLTVINATTTNLSVSGTAYLPNDSITPNDVHTTGQTDEYCLTYEATGTTWEWQTCGAGGGTGAGTATTSGQLGLPGSAEDLTYSNNDFLVGGSASTTAEFAFDPETSIFTISSSTAASSTFTNTSDLGFVFENTSGDGFWASLATAGDVIWGVAGSVTEWIVQMAVTFQGTLTATGVVDFGGSTSVEINNGTNPTIDAAGEIAVNTSTSSIRWHDGTAERQIKSEFPVFGTTLASSSLEYTGSFGAAGTTTVKRAGLKYPVFVTEMYCKTNTGTAFWQLGDGTASSSLQCTTSGATNSSPNLTFTNREDFFNALGTTSGTPGEIFLDVTGYWVAD